MKVFFDHMARESPLAVTFYFRPESPVRYQAGQYIALTLPHAQPDDRGITRSFTLSSAPTEPFLSITTKVAIPDPSTYTQALLALSQGDQLTMSRPMGDFVLPGDNSVPLVFVARGLGVTPFRSMMAWLRDKRQTRTIHMLYETEDETEVVFLDLFAEQGANLDLTVQPDPSQTDIDGLCAKITVAAGRSAQIFLSGSARMVTALRAALMAKGVSDKRIVLDAMTPNEPVHGTKRATI